MKALLEDPSIDAVVPILLLTADTGIPSYQFIVDLAAAFPEKPVMVSFSGDKRYVDECREFLEPRGVATFLEIEEPFEALSILARCAASPPLLSSIRRLAAALVSVRSMPAVRTPISATTCTSSTAT